ncbi:hypothetical protein [Escherichia phage vB_EcoM-UFV05]|nr:hypothetical protein [Escherichia phage vB_EcoM-UFV09]UYE93103.1 hypothetical protein [Escherichia phage vB_EcoM-UFV05]UYL83996.1 hypothetical protein [Escherichia phage vB_EcoM-UFV06]UYL84282.1 hypothetical protein [Escherichia phage vB_EcoM-UFV10]UYL84568.1 hypothetical protein [Escherichia phage vB_EcoM-UFV11]WQN07392.1 hypothetical protein [Escherichia phage vB-Eco-KMB23]
MYSTIEEQGCKQFCEKFFKKFWGILGQGGEIKG